MKLGLYEEDMLEIHTLDFEEAAIVFKFLSVINSLKITNLSVRMGSCNYSGMTECCVVVVKKRNKSGKCSCPSV